MFNQQELEARINAANEKFVSGEEVLNAPPDPNAKPHESRELGSGKEPAPWLPIDLYQHGQRKQFLESQRKRPNGSSSLVKAVTKSIIEGKGGLAMAKKRVDADSELYKSRGDKLRYQLVVQQYMQEKFLPAIEAVIDYTSPDELLNCKEALDALDSMAIGVGRMNGYTASYVQKAYGNVLGQKEGKSDPTIREIVGKIKALVGGDQISSAVGLASKAKKGVDSGANMASEEDYELISRVSSYAN